MKKLSVFAFAASAIVLCGCDQKEEKAMTPVPAQEVAPATLPAATSTETTQQTSSMNEGPTDLATIPHTIDFKKAAWPGVVSKVEGLSGAEPWGTWSEGDKVVIEFTTPLPEKFTVHLTAIAFGPNAEKDFIMHVGDSSNTFKIAGQSEDKAIEFTNPERSNVLTINVPSPISPKEIGMSEDGRKLGIGLVQLKVSAE